MPLLHRCAHNLRTTAAFARTTVRSTPGRPYPTLPQLFHQHAAMSQAARLKGKTIVITGASSGIGRACAVEFARTQPDDLKLVLTARRFDTLKEVAAEIGGFAKGVKVHPVKLDVSKPEEVDAFVGSLPDEFRNVDVLVNNA